ncbi:MAG: tyrosine-type recombinase/integrase, partial [Streptosporangiaceae bacterium]
MLDLTDFTVNPAAEQLGGLGVCHVRFGKAMRGSPPRRRAVASVMPWAVGALAEYLAEVRPRFECADPAPVWPAERGVRISARSAGDRFALCRP